MFSRIGIFAMVAAVGVFMCLPASGGSTSAPAKDYAIKLSRPSKVGQTFNFTASGSDKKTQTATIGGQTRTRKEAIAFEVSGVYTITKVDKKGDTLSVTVTLDRCVRLDGDKRTEVASKGTVAVVSTVDGKRAIESKDSGKGLSADAQKILGLTFQKHASPVNGDDAFGTNKRQKAGDSWPVNREFIAKSLGEVSQGTVDKKDVAGQMKLLGVKEVSGKECLSLQSYIQLKDIKDILPGVTVQKSALAFSCAAMLPTDPSLPRLVEKMSMTMSMAMKVKGKDGAEIPIEITSERSLTQTRTPIKK